MLGFYVIMHRRLMGGVTALGLMLIGGGGGSNCSNNYVHKPLPQVFSKQNPVNASCFADSAWKVVSCLTEYREKDTSLKEVHTYVHVNPFQTIYSGTYFFIGNTLGPSFTAPVNTGVWLVFKLSGI